MSSFNPSSTTTATASSASSALFSSFHSPSILSSHGEKVQVSGVWWDRLTLLAGDFFPSYCSPLVVVVVVVVTMVVMVMMMMVVVVVMMAVVM